MDNDTARRIRELKSEIEYYEDRQSRGPFDIGEVEFLDRKIVFLRSELAKIDAEGQGVLWEAK